MLEVRGVGHWFGSNRFLHDLNLRIARGQIVALVGPSGCGKSTLLRAILGTDPAKAGRVYMNGQAVDRPGRDRGIVYQRYALYPFMTARQNVAFGLMLDQTSIPQRLLGFYRWSGKRREHLEQADAWLAKVGLSDAADRYPHELSGGMRQRVAFAAAKVMQPELLLLDEPFGALDEATREDLQQMLLLRYRENVEATQAGKTPPHTILIVTHELNEALFVADRVIGLSQYWDWRAAGHDTVPGATIVYDQPAPIYPVGAVRENDAFMSQRQQIRSVVFSQDNTVVPKDHVGFWQRWASETDRTTFAGSVLSAQPGGERDG
ncbi:MAG: ATP-binding cassette domain-containing protein [Planctomycetota bacterium]